MIGIASTIARVTGPQWTRRSSLLDEQPVREQGQDQRQLDQVDDRRVVGVDRDHVGRRQADPERHREHRDREHRAPHHPRQRRGDRQQRAEQQDRLAEPDIHARAYIRFSGRPAGGYQST